MMASDGSMAPATFASSSSVVVIGVASSGSSDLPDLLADQAVAGKRDRTGHRHEQRHDEEAAEDERLHGRFRGRRSMPGSSPDTLVSAWTRSASFDSG